MTPPTVQGAGGDVTPGPGTPAESPAGSSAESPAHRATSDGGEQGGDGRWPDEDHQPTQSYDLSAADQQPQQPYQPHGQPYGGEERPLPTADQGGYSAAPAAASPPYDHRPVYGKPGQYDPQDDAGYDPNAYAGTSGYPPPRPRRRKTAVIAGIFTAVILVAAAAGGWLLFLTHRGSSDTHTLQSSAPKAATPSASVPGTPLASAPASPTPSLPPPATGLGLKPVSALRAGLFCRDLNAKGYGYATAVDYWRLHGEPDMMDADLNGIPCETVYSPSVVASYWASH